MNITDASRKRLQPLGGVFICVPMSTLGKAIKIEYRAFKQACELIVEGGEFDD